MSKPKTYERFYVGTNVVSRCWRCGRICFDVKQEEEHDAEKCRKEKLVPIPAKDKVVLPERQEPNS